METNSELQQPISSVDLSTPFVDGNMTKVWKAQVESPLRTKEDVEKLSLQDSLEPDPANRNAAMRQERFKDFWTDTERLEWKGLWESGCFRKWKQSDLLPSDSVFGSRYHYKIKHCVISGKISKFKVRLVVQGHRMK